MQRATRAQERRHIPDAFQTPSCFEARRCGSIVLVLVQTQPQHLSIVLLTRVWKTVVAIFGDSIRIAPICRTFRKLLM